MISVRTIAMAAVAFVGLLTTAYGASFDCSKAESQIERLICASPKLSALDDELGVQYRHQLERTPDAGGARDEVRNSQRAWLRYTRNVCADESCLVSAYGQRVAALKQARALFEEAKSNAEQEDANPPPNIGKTVGVASSTPTIVMPAASASTPQAEATATEAASAPQIPSSEVNKSTVNAASENASSAIKVPVNPKGKTWQNMIFLLALVFIMVGSIGSLIFLFKRKFTTSIVLTMILGWVGIYFVTVGGPNPDDDFFDMAQQLPVSTFLPDLNGLKFGDSPSRLPKDFVLVERTAKEIQTDKDLEREYGDPPCELYRSTRLRPELQGMSVRVVTVCFDGGRLLRVIAELDQNDDAMATLKARVEGIQGKAGKRDPYADYGFGWERSINGIKEITTINRALGIAIYAVEVDHKHLKGKRSADVSGSSKDTETQKAADTGSFPNPFHVPSIESITGSTQNPSIPARELNRPSRLEQDDPYPITRLAAIVYSPNSGCTLSDVGEAKIYLREALRLDSGPDRVQKEMARRFANQWVQNLERRGCGSR